MKQKRERIEKDKKGTSAYKTFPLANDKVRDPKTNAAIPSIDDVEELRQWVEFNKK